MHIFIDESGTFSKTDRKHSVSAVGALIIPDQNMTGFEKLYGRVRRKLPTDKGEVKGRQLNEAQVAEVVDILRKLQCLFEVIAIDSEFQSEADIEAHKAAQEEGLTKNLTDEHHENLTNQVWEVRKQLEQTPLQLYVQSCALSELVYQTLYHADMYYAYRFPKELRPISLDDRCERA